MKRATAADIEATLQAALQPESLRVEGTSLKSERRTPA